MKTLKDYLAETIRRYGAVGASPGMGYTLEDTAEVKYGVYAKGGSVGDQKWRNEPIKTFNNKEEAIAFAKHRRAGLSKGERSYYRMSYIVKPIKGVAEGEGMSRAAKGYEKYGKEGMQALAKAGREGRALDPVRDRYDRYDEGVAEAGKPDVMRHAGDTTVKVVKRRGVPVGEIGIDAEASEGNGQYYVKLYDGSYDASGFDTAKEALEELKYAISSGMDEDAASNDPLLAKAVDLAPVGALEENAELRLILQRAKLIE